MSKAPAVQSIGHVLAVNGLVVTVRFGDERPKPNELLHVEDRPDILLVWREYTDRQTARYINIAGASGLTVRMPVFSSGHTLAAPTGKGAYGRVFDALGRPIDGLAAPETDIVPVYREAARPQFRPSSSEVLTTGIKVIDFFAPFVKGRKIGIIGGAGVGRRYSRRSLFIIFRLRRRQPAILLGLASVYVRATSCATH